MVATHGLGAECPTEPSGVRTNILDREVDSIFKCRTYIRERTDSRDCKNKTKTSLEARGELETKCVAAERHEVRTRRLIAGLAIVGAVTTMYLLKRAT